MECCTEPLPQHLSALHRANEVRLFRAALKRQIKAHEAAARDVLLDVPEQAEGMTILDLLMAQERWGRSRCLRLLATAVALPDGRTVPIRETKTLGAMTQRQREVVAAALPSREAVAARRVSEHRRGAVSPALAAA